MKKIELVFPVVKVTLRDVANLRSFAEVNKIKCTVSDADTDRLRALGLIETRNLGPCPVESAKCKRLYATADRMLRRATKSTKIDWKLINEAKAKRPSDYSLPKDRIRVMLTKAGAKFLSLGSVKVEIQKPC